MTWYAIYTKPRHEKKVDLALREKLFETYLPMLTQTRKWKDRKKSVDLPLFSSYLFVNFDYKLRFNLLDTPGIVKIINFSGEPAEIPEWQIESLKRILEFPETLRPERHFTPGQIVEIIDGPMRGLRGTIVKSKKKDRLVLTIDGIMQSVSVLVDRSAVKRILENPSETE